MAGLYLVYDDYTRRNCRSHYGYQMDRIKTVWGLTNNYVISFSIVVRALVL